MPNVDGAIRSGYAPEREGAGVHHRAGRGVWTAGADTSSLLHVLEQQRGRRLFRAPTAYLIDFYWLSSSI